MKVYSASKAITEFSIDSSNIIDASTIFIVKDEKYGISLGKNNIILSACVINCATGYRESTVIGNNNYIGPSTTINSDTLIGNNNTITGCCYLGFHSVIQNNVYIEYNAHIQNYSTVGSYSFIGTFSPIIKDVKPFCKVFGNPSKIRGTHRSSDFRKRFNETQRQEIEAFVKNDIEPTDPYLISIIDEYRNFSRKKATQ